MNVTPPAARPLTSLPAPLVLGLVCALFLSCGFPKARPAMGSGADLYYRAADMETAASTPSQWERAARTYLEAYAESDDPELSAASLFAAAQIFESGAGNREKALENYRKLMKEFPGSTWASKAEAKLKMPDHGPEARDSRDRETEDSAEPVSPASGRGRSSRTSRDSAGPGESSDSAANEVSTGSYRRRTVPFDPARLTRDLIEPISPEEAAEIMRDAEEAARAPHMPPEPADAEPTGDSILDGQAKSAGGKAMEIDDYSMALNMQNPARGLRETVMVKVSLKNNRCQGFAIAFKTFQIYSGPGGRFLFFPSPGISAKLKEGTRAAEVTDSILKHLAFALELGGARQSLVAHLAATEDRKDLVELFFTETRGPVFFILGILQESKQITDFSIMDFESRKLIVHGDVSEMAFNQNFESTAFEPPASARKAPVPVEFALPPIFMR